MRYIWSEQKRLHISDGKDGKLCDANPKTIADNYDPGPYTDVPLKDLNGTNLICARCQRMFYDMKD